MSSKLDSFIKEDSKENFHEYLRSVTNIVSNNVYRDKDNTFRLLNRLRKNENIVVLSADKESCTVILNKTDYVNKVNEMINEGISKGKYIETVDSTHKDLKHFQDFLYRHFYKTTYYDGMRPISNQPARFFATAKTHKFDTAENINVKDLKLKPIIDQTGTYIYDASKIVAEFLKPHARNEFTISDTLAFPELLKNIENSDDYEDVSYNVESLFTSIPIKEMHKIYIMHKIYTKNVIEPMCKKSIFKKLLIKLTKECTFSVNNRLIKQIDGCPMGGPISVVFAHIFMCKMEDDVVPPIKPLFYKRYVDDTYVRRKKNTKDELFEKLNTYHRNIKLTTEENPTKFLDSYSCVIYRGICSCGADYIGETVRNAQLRWNEHENGTDKNSECAKHLNENNNHKFKWSILSLAPKISFKRKILEAYFIKTLNPILNNQLNSDILTLFINGVT